MAASCLAATREAFEEAARLRTAASLEIEHSEFEFEGMIDITQARSSSITPIPRR